MLAFLKNRRSQALVLWLRSSVCFMGACFILAYGASGLLAYPASSDSSLTQQRPAPFLTSLNDIPVMTGLREQVDKGVAFETPAGRIIDAEVLGPHRDLGVIISFYDATLASLGWQMLGHGRYLREGEVLQITPSRFASGVRVHFSLRPQ
jgi:hypothetical protein